MGKKIMVVDDEDAIRLLYEEEFGDDGYEVVTCSNGEEALEKFDEEKPDLVILDIAMPGMNGLEVLGKIKEKSPDTPVIMSTAYSHYKGDFYTYVADAYVVKSPDLSELKEKVRQLLKSNKNLT